MKLKLVGIFIIAFVCVSYAIQWYRGESVPAWQALIWAFIVMMNDVIEYLESKY